MTWIEWAAPKPHNRYLFVCPSLILCCGRSRRRHCCRATFGSEVYRSYGTRRCALSLRRGLYSAASTAPRPTRPPLISPQRNAISKPLLLVPARCSTSSVAQPLAPTAVDVSSSPSAYHAFAGALAPMPPNSSLSSRDGRLDSASAHGNDPYYSNDGTSMTFCSSYSCSSRH